MSSTINANALRSAWAETVRRLSAYYGRWDPKHLISMPADNDLVTQIVHAMHHEGIATFVLHMPAKAYPPGWPTVLAFFIYTNEDGDEWIDVRPCPAIISHDPRLVPCAEYRTGAP